VRSDLVPWTRNRCHKLRRPPEAGWGRSHFAFPSHAGNLQLAHDSSVQGNLFIFCGAPRRGVPRFFPELASNLVVIVNKTYARNHVYGGLVSRQLSQSQSFSMPSTTDSQWVRKKLSSIS
jgi:hypothetical protein